jgi:hypothetical protein
MFAFSMWVGLSLHFKLSTNHNCNLMEVEIFLKNGVVPLVVSVKDGKCVVHDHTFSTKFKLEISSILLKKVILNSMGEVAWKVLQEPIENGSRKKWQFSP